MNKDQVDLSFFWRKLHSFLGIFPVGVFLIIHMINNSFAVKGPESFENIIKILHSLPYLILIEIFFIGLPILIHGVYGVIIALDAKYNLLTYGYARNWRYFLQRITAYITLVFVIFHVWQLRICNSGHIDFNLMTNLVNNSTLLIIYIIGLAAAVYHFSNGIWSFLISWGISPGVRAQKIISWICLFFGIALFCAGMNALLAFMGKAIIIS